MKSNRKYWDEFGKRMKAARKELGLTQVELAEKTGLFQTQITDYEKGKRRPDDKNLLAIAKVLELDPDTLFLGDGEYNVEYTKYGIHVNMKYTEKALKNVELNPKYNKLNNNQKQLVNDLIDVLLEN